MTTAAQRVVIDLVGYAQRATDDQLITLINDTIDIEHRTLVHALVVTIVGLINHGAAGTWTTVVDRLALDDN